MRGSRWTPRDENLTTDQIIIELDVVRQRLQRFSVGTDRRARAERRILTLEALLAERHAATATMHGGEQ